MGLFFTVRGKSPAERAVRTLAMVCVILVVVWAFWKNNENVIAKLERTQAYWDETGQGKQYIKSFARDFAKSMEEDFGMASRVWILRGELPELDPEEGQLVLALSPSTKKADLAMNPATDSDRELAQSLRDGFFDEYWDSGWEAGVEAALVQIWNHYSGETTNFFDVVSTDGLDAPAAAIVDETDTMTEEDLAFVERFVAGMDKEFGQQASVRVFQQEVILPDSVNKVVFIGLSPSRKEVLVAFPPLVKKALPPGFETMLMTEHFPPYFESGDWVTGLKTALVATWKGLAGEPMNDPMNESTNEPMDKTQGSTEQ